MIQIQLLKKHFIYIFFIHYSFSAHLPTCLRRFPFQNKLSQWWRFQLIFVKRQFVNNHRFTVCTGKLHYRMRCTRWLQGKVVLFSFTQNTRNKLPLNIFPFENSQFFSFANVFDLLLRAAYGWKKTVKDIMLKLCNICKKKTKLQNPHKMKIFLGLNIKFIRS